MAVETSRKLLALLPPDESNYSDNCAVEAARVQSKSVPKSEGRKVVYGRDLSPSDLLLLGVNKSLREIMTNEYGIGSDFRWDYPPVVTTTSKKVIVDDGRNKYFIKEKPKYCCSPYSLSLSSQFQDYLSKGTDFVPKIIYTKSGSPFLQIGEPMFFTTEYREGRMFNASEQDVENAGVALGVIHTLSREFKFSNPRNVHASDDSIEFVDLANKLNGAENDKWRQETVNLLRATVEKYKNQLDGDDTVYIANHGDYAPFNLVYGQNGSVVAVNDFDNVNFRPRTRDIAGALLSFCDGLSYAGATSTLRKPIATTMNLDKARAFMKGYLVNPTPLSPKEKTDLVGEMCVRWVKIMALGIVRGDFNYKEVLDAAPFLDFVRANLRKVI